MKIRITIKKKENDNCDIVDINCKVVPGARVSWVPDASWLFLLGRDEERRQPQLFGHHGKEKWRRGEEENQLEKDFDWPQVGMSYCHGLGGNQVFAYTKRQQVYISIQAVSKSFYIWLASTFVLSQVMSDDNCLDAAGADGPVKLVRCHGMGGNQAWVYNKMDK